MDAIHVANKNVFIDWNYILLIQGVSELLKSYYAYKKGRWPGQE